MGSAFWESAPDIDAVKCTCKYCDALTEAMAELRVALAPQAASVTDAMTAPTEKIFQSDFFILPPFSDRVVNRFHRLRSLHITLANVERHHFWKKRSSVTRE